MMFLLLALSLSGKCNPAPVSAAPVAATREVTGTDVRDHGAAAEGSRKAGERDTPAYRKRMKEDS